MPATAETTRSVLAIPNMEADAEQRHHAARFIGAVAAGRWNQVEYGQLTADEALQARPLESLYDALHAAAEGDPVAARMVRTNVRTDVVERTIKSGHIMEVDLMVDEAGRIQQYGQSLESVQANSLRFASDDPQMRQRVEAETRNTFRLQHCLQQGQLDDYSFVVFSRAADDMGQADMQRAGFFTDTMSCAIQVTTMKQGRLVMESAFVAGAQRPGATRHDAATITKLLRRWGVDAEGLSATELLDMPLLVHNSLLSDGATSIVEGYDDAAGGRFFGEAKPRQDYRAYRRLCTEREAGFGKTINDICAELIAETPHITSRLGAAERLNTLSGKHMIKRAIIDTSIDPAVFGDKSARAIESGRFFYEAGEYERMEAELKTAVRHDQSSSCPSGMAGSHRTGLHRGEAASATDSDEDQYGALTFKCPKGHANRRPRGKLLESCQKCGVSVRC